MLGYRCEQFNPIRLNFLLSLLVIKSVVLVKAKSKFCFFTSHKTIVLLQCITILNFLLVLESQDKHFTTYVFHNFDTTPPLPNLSSAKSANEV